MRRKLWMCSTAFVVILFLTLSVMITFRNFDLEETNAGTVPSTTVLPIFIQSKYVTRALNELGPMDELNAHVLFFNRVPKSGSEMLLLLVQWLQGWNNFRHIRLKDDNKRRFSKFEQVSYRIRRFILYSGMFFKYNFICDFES